MNGKCNLLKPVDCNTGTFFMFSQYAQDLTKQYTNNDSYRCLPSKFIAIDLNTIQYDKNTLGELFQNYFENSCSIMRNEDQQDFNPEYTLYTLFRLLNEKGLITTVNNNNVGVCDNIKYIGEINIYGYQPTKDGIGYSEIYCHIPNDAKDTRYHIYEYGQQHTQGGFKKYHLPANTTHISGWEGTSITPSGLSAELSNNSINYYDGDSNNMYYQCSGKLPKILKDNTGECFNITNNTFFEFNTIVVLYDIVSKNNNNEDVYVYRNIPLGVWFTGTPELTNNNKITNYVTKYVSDSSIYNQGTGYGLRICSRFLCTPLLTRFESVEGTVISEDECITHLLSDMSNNITLFNELSRDVANMNNGLIEHVNTFRNNKTNVPYTREVNGRYYWFVNGRNTGVPANDSADITELDSRINELENNLEGRIDTIISNYNFNIDSATTEDIEEAVNIFQNNLR